MGTFTLISVYGFCPGDFPVTVLVRYHHRSKLLASMAARIDYRVVSLDPRGRGVNYGSQD